MFGLPQTAHNVLKKVVVDVLGERPPGVAWRIGDEAKFLRNVRSALQFSMALVQHSVGNNCDRDRFLRTCTTHCTSGFKSL